MVTGGVGLGGVGLGAAELEGGGGVPATVPGVVGPGDTTAVVPPAAAGSSTPGASFVGPKMLVVDVVGRADDGAVSMEAVDSPLLAAGEGEDDGRAAVGWRAAP